MSEIQRYMYARDGMVPDAEHLRGSGEPEFWVRFTDHEAERAENLATIDFLNKELRSAVDALADAKARIEGNLDEYPGTDSPYRLGYMAARRAALAALTQPQTDEDARIEREIAELERRADKLKKRYHGDLEARCESLAREVENPAVHGGRTPPWFKSIAASIRALPMDDEEPGPYAKAFRERVCPVPEFPGIKAGSVDQYPDHVAPVPQTEGEEA